MTLNRHLFAAVLVGATFTVIGCVAPRAALADPTPAQLQAEEARHPRLVQAIQDMRAALAELEAAPDNFGGNKAAAIRDTRAAIHSVRRALYFRLHMDDAALDRLP